MAGISPRGAVLGIHPAARSSRNARKRDKLIYKIVCNTLRSRLIFKPHAGMRDLVGHAATYSCGVMLRGGRRKRPDWTGKTAAVVAAS